MNWLRDLQYRLNIRSFRDVRENKAIMGGAAGLLCLFALLVLVRALIGGGDAPSGPTEADLAAQSTMEHLREHNPPPPVEPEVQHVEPGAGRKMQEAPG